MGTGLADTVNIKEIILELLENERQRKILYELYENEGSVSFKQLKETCKIKSSTTLVRELKFFDSIGVTVNIFERTKEGSYSHYELTHFGKRIAQIIMELEEIVEEKIKEIPA
jgi:DNA-binding HxlR family transcriptional regulator